MALERGDRLGPYEILSKLGAGGMGEVYAALDTRLRREVAVKVLPPEEMANEERRSAFQREARAASALNHPNIITIHEIGSEDGIDYIVMERVAGRTLSQMIPPEGMNIEDAIRHFITLAEALARAHHAGIVHRDLKPGNVMVTDDNRVKILDFGVAKLVKAAGPLAPSGADLHETITQAAEGLGRLAGTSAYMSPEQATGRPVDPRSDIFSLGIVLYEALAGKRPWEGPTGMAVLQGVCLLDPPALRKVRPGLPAALEAVVMKALRKQPEERYQTMEEFAAALLAVAAGRGRLWPKARVLRALALAAAGAGLIGGVAYLWPARKAEAPAPRKMQVADPFEAYRQARALMVRSDRPQSVDRAIPLLEAAIAGNPGHAPFHAALSDAYVLKFSEARDKAWLAKAQTVAEEALKLNPYLAAAHISRAALDASSGKSEDAVKNLRRALALDPKNAEAHWRLAARLNLGGRLEEALGEARLAAELAPEDWRSANALGSVQHAAGQYRNSLEQFERALKLAPDSPVVNQNIAAASHMLGEWEDAAAALQRALEVRPTATGYSNLGTVLYFQGLFDDAVAAFEKAVALRPNEHLYTGNLADAYRWSAAKKEQAVPAYTRALAFAREAAKARPQDANLRASIAAYLAKSGQTEAALRELTGLPTGEARPGVFYKSAVIRELAGDRAGALAALKSGLAAGLSFHEVEHDPEFAELRKDRGFRQLAAAGKKR
jgi:tetratricopeptide (TPR) repeat protein/tRNA A-37 threonylcarbamoyl transferase component Bud32